MKTLKDFIDKFRLVCTDTWDDAYDAWFEAVGQMWVRNLPIPAQYKYVPGSKYQTLNPDSPFHDDFRDLDDETVVLVATYLTRYLKLVDKKVEHE